MDTNLPTPICQGPSVNLPEGKYWGFDLSWVITIHRSSFSTGWLFLIEAFATIRNNIGYVEWLLLEYMFFIGLHSTDTWIDHLFIVISVNDVW